MVSNLAKKILGLFVADDTKPKPPTIAWMQNECRRGSLRVVIDEFIQDNPEPMDAGLLLVEKIDESGITCRIPCRMRDHESPHAFRIDVRLKVDPAGRTATRLAD